MSHSGTFKLTDITISSNEPFPYCSDNVYVKTENGVDIIYGSRKIQNAKHVICGTKIVTPASAHKTSIQLFTTNEIRQMFNDTSSLRYMVTVSVDWHTRKAQTVTYQNNAYFLVFTGTINHTNPIDVNYMIVAY